MEKTKQKPSVAFSGKLNYHSQFRKAIDIASNLTEAGILNFSNEGMTIKEYFKNMTGLLDISINKKDFDKYFLREPTKIAVDLEQLLKAIKCAGSDARIEIMKDSITVKDEHNKFVLPLLEGSDREDVNEDKLNLKFERTIKLRASDITDIINKTQKFLGNSNYGGNTISFALTNLTLKAHSQDINKQAEFTIALQEGIKRHEKEDKPIVSAFNDTILKDVLRAKGLESEVEMSFGKDQPLQAQFANGTANARFIVAPIVEGN